ncbi:MAG: hypothetical protein JO252_29460 [Planctomycetaceae bacterium]|nr:hypothetical protein [Planctomycetaceae bacterium]
MIRRRRGPPRGRGGELSRHRGGLLFLGYAGSRWTKFFSKRDLGYVTSVGVKLFVLYFMIVEGVKQ